MACSKSSANSKPHVSVINPVNQSESKIRRNVAPSLLPRLEANRRNRADVRLFEIGKAYEPENGNDRGEPAERHLLALAWAGQRPGKKAGYAENRLMGLQAIVDDLVRSRGCGTPQWSADGDRPAWAHPGKCLFLRLDGTDDVVGVVAEIEPGLAPQLGLSGDLDSEVALGEFCLDALLNALGCRLQAASEIPGDQGRCRRVLRRVDERGRADRPDRAGGQKQVADVELFDLYRGESIGEGPASPSTSCSRRDEDADR